MLSTMTRKFADLILFLTGLFGVLYIALIVADDAAFRVSLQYYFWIVAPLYVIGILIGTANIFVQSLKRNKTA